MDGFHFDNGVLRARWAQQGLNPAEAEARVLSNDLPNAAYVRENSALPVIVMRQVE